MTPSNITQVLSLLHKEYPDARYYLNFRTPVDLITATILSAQCRDEVVNEATEQLFKKYSTTKDYVALTPGELEKDIKSITFFQNKAKNIIGAFQMIEKDFGGKVPNTMDALTSLPGIGRKTANAILQNAFNKVEGIIVDTHVIRLSQRLGWTKNKNPDKIEQDLMRIIPEKEWKELPHLLKNHGRKVCTAQQPNCAGCTLNKICPSAFKV